jgi:hypothetical protein
MLLRSGSTLLGKPSDLSRLRSVRGPLDLVADFRVNGPLNNRLGAPADLVSLRTLLQVKPATRRPGVCLGS